MQEFFLVLPVQEIQCNTQSSTIVKIKFFKKEL